MSKIVGTKSCKDKEEKIGFLKNNLPESEECKRMRREVCNKEIRKTEEKLISACNQSTLITYLSE